MSYSKTIGGRPNEMPDIGVLSGRRNLDLLWLELTERCNLECSHCYASSSPRKGHGLMIEADWLRIVAEAKDTGCTDLILIGGEPTLHPSFEAIVRRAHALGFSIEVYSNLLSVSARLWRLFQECGVRLATSFYTSDPAAHDQVTQRPGSYSRTLTNIERAIGNSLPLRVGLILASEMDDEDATCDLLRSKGVTNIGVDRVRGVGRGGQAKACSVDELCGACADNRLAVVPDGSVYPCVFSRWLPVGNVLEQELRSILDGAHLSETAHMLRDEFRRRDHGIPVTNCNPQQIPPNCGPNRCRPDQCQTG